MTTRAELKPYTASLLYRRVGSYVRMMDAGGVGTVAIKPETLRGLRDELAVYQAEVAERQADDAGTESDKWYLELTRQALVTALARLDVVLAQPDTETQHEQGTG